DNAATPLERPDELADRATLTDAEVAQLKAKAAELFSGDGDAGFGDTIFLAALRNILGKENGFKSRDVGTGDYNSFWVVGRWFEHRTSLITDPPSGKLPPTRRHGRPRRLNTARRTRSTGPRTSRSASGASRGACRCSAPATTTTIRSSNRRRTSRSTWRCGTTRG